MHLSLYPRWGATANDWCGHPPAAGGASAGGEKGRGTEEEGAPRGSPLHAGPGRKPWLLLKNLYILWCFEYLNYLISWYHQPADIRFTALVSVHRYDWTWFSLLYDSSCMHINCSCLLETQTGECSHWSGEDYSTPCFINLFRHGQDKVTFWNANKEVCFCAACTLYKHSQWLLHHRHRA